MSTHQQHVMHDNSLEVYRELILSGKANSLEAKCYKYIKEHRGTHDEAIAKAVRGHYYRRQDVPPRITRLIKANLVREFAAKNINNRPVRLLEAVPVEPGQMELV